MKSAVKLEDHLNFFPKTPNFWQERFFWGKTAMLII